MRSYEHVSGSIGYLDISAWVSLFIMEKFLNNDRTSTFT